MIYRMNVYNTDPNNFTFNPTRFYKYFDEDRGLELKCGHLANFALVSDTRIERLFFRAPASIESQSVEPILHANSYIWVGWPVWAYDTTAFWPDMYGGEYPLDLGLQFGSRPRHFHAPLSPIKAFQTYVGKFGGNHGVVLMLNYDSPTRSPYSSKKKRYAVNVKNEIVNLLPSSFRENIYAGTEGTAYYSSHKVTWGDYDNNL